MISYAPGPPGGSPILIGSGRDVSALQTFPKMFRPHVLAELAEAILGVLSAQVDPGMGEKRLDFVHFLHELLLRQGRRRGAIMKEVETHGGARTWGAPVVPILGPLQERAELEVRHYLRRQEGADTWAAELVCCDLQSIALPHRIVLQLAMKGAQDAGDDHFLGLAPLAVATGDHVGAGPRLLALFLDMLDCVDKRDRKPGVRKSNAVQCLRQVHHASYRHGKGKIGGMRIGAKPVLVDPNRDLVTLPLHVTEAVRVEDRVSCPWPLFACFLFVANAFPFPNPIHQIVQIFQGYLSS